LKSETHQSRTGINLEPHKRIEAIKKTLIIYTNENIQKQTIMIKRLKRSRLTKAKTEVIKEDIR
jgi:hypothetical protein